MRRSFGLFGGLISRSCSAAAVFFALTAPVFAQEHEYSADQIQSGYRLYVGQCQICHGNNGDNIAGVNLSRQQFKTVRSDDDIRRMITTGNPAGMPPFVLKPEELDDLVAFVRSGMDQGGVAFRLGDATRGKAVYDKAGCAQCHRIAGQGARTAPDLTDIGFIRRPGQMVTSLTNPNNATQPINRPITVITKDGRTIKGRRYDEDTFSVRLIDSKERMLSIQKSDISSYDIGMTSDMPSYQGKLTDDEISDLLAYLVSLKG
jgi:putative heme-binding domain-containing protein